MVWDTIHVRDVGVDAPIEEWGGIAYALAAADAALPADWSIFPIIKVGSDLREAADEFFATLSSLGSLDGVRTVPDPNNRVELFYHTAGRRCERLTGGIPPWGVEQILPLARSCDALYVNFIAGWELDLASAIALRGAVEGPVYCDIHSLMLGVGSDGMRALRPLEDWRAWMRAFDIVQLNEEELATVADGRGDPWILAAAEILGPRTGALLVTLGERGSAWVSTRRFWERPLEAPSAHEELMGDPGQLLSGNLEAASTAQNPDPTGCGDVWGATCFSSLLGGSGLEPAMRDAGLAAAKNTAYRGATGLNAYLRSPSGPVANGGTG